jgi:CheY-like chemotaxis protein
MMPDGIGETVTMEAQAKILVVEDEGLVAMMLEQGLIDCGYDVVGPAPDTKKALSLLAAQAIDAAVLDVNLGNERVDPVAEALAAASIPFIFCTGYTDPSALPPGFRDRTMLHKPYRIQEVNDALIQLLTETN